MLGHVRAEKNSAKCWLEGAKFRVLDRHRSRKPTTAPWNLNGARSLGAPTHPLVTVFTKRPVIGGGRRPGVWYNTLGRCCVENRRQKISIPLRWQKIGRFSSFGEERRTPWATCRSLDHGSTWYLRGRHLLHRPCPTRSGLAVGWLYVEIGGLSSRELFLTSVLAFFNVKAHVPPRTAAWTNNPKQSNIFPPVFPIAAVRQIILSRFFFVNISSLKRKLCNIAFPLSSV